MLGENIKTLRKQKGYSQETLAQQLNVVRQTVSKWEKGLSVPDAELLEKIAALFDVPVSTLLGSKIPEAEQAPDKNAVAEQLAILNDQLAKQHAFRRRVLRTVVITIVSIIATLTVISILAFSLFAVNTSSSVEGITTEENVEIIE